MFRTMKAFGQDRFEWMVCYNGMSEDQMKNLEYIVQKRPIQLLQQIWDDCPVPDTHWTPIRSDGKVEVDGKKCGGTLWKICPARLDINRHEIVMDNDIVMFRNLPAIDEFLDCDHKTLVLEEPIRFYGRYDHLMGSKDRLNSGLMGFPPGYNFGACLLDNWEQFGRLKYLSQADEQGLLMYTLNQQPNTRVTKFDVRELLAKDSPDLTGQEFGIHFVQANRVNSGHRGWIYYQNEIKNAVTFL